MEYGAMNFPVKPVIEEIESISKLGFDYLELAMDPPEAHHTDIRQHQGEIIAALRKHQMGLVCHLPTFVYTADLSDRIREASVDEVVASLEVAAELHPQKVVLHPGYISGLGIHVMKKSIAYAMQSLEQIMDRADYLGMRVCIENMFPKYPGWIKADDFNQILDRFPSIMLTLDIGHAHIGSKNERRALQFMDAFPDRIQHIHVSDNFGKEDSHLPIGAGNIRYKEMVKGLKKICYNGTITVEVFSSDREFLRLSKERISQLFERA
jgi:sugar phosphate isomerase/epimerase